LIFYRSVKLPVNFFIHDVSATGMKHDQSRMTNPAGLQIPKYIIYSVVTLSLMKSLSRVERVEGHDSPFIENTR